MLLSNRMFYKKLPAVVSVLLLCMSSSSFAGFTSPHRERVDDPNAENPHTLFSISPADADDEKAERCPSNPSCSLLAAPVRGSIAIDGRLDEVDWQSAAVATDFKQFEPNEGADPSQRTEVRVLFGETALYIGATLYDSEPDQILRTLGRRDELSQADWFIVAIDSYFDRKTAYNFAINAAGVQADGILTSGFFTRPGGFSFDTSWDAVWYPVVRITNEGWVVEMRIPYSMLRFPEADSQRWGINFRRMIPRSGETVDWVLIPRTEMMGGVVSRYGTLEGLTDIRPRKNVQIAPYTRSQVLTEEGDPGKLQSTRDMAVGGDLKIGISTNVTLDATINPDFGQVESDPAILNLTAFEMFFPERRPFFTEGVQIFNFQIDRGGSLLYTRRIGADAPIIGASKLSGRTSRGLSFGLFGAVTGTDFKPDRYYGVGRLQQQIGGLSSLGGMLTFFDDGDDRRSYTGGLDWDFRLDDNKYRIEGHTTFTHRAIPGLDIEPESGFSFAMGFNKISGIWNLFSGIDVYSDEYNPNDIGILRRNNYVNIDAGFRHQVNGGQPIGPFRRGSIMLFGNNDFSYRDRYNMGLGFNINSDWQTHNFQEISIRSRSDYLLGGYDIYETRGLYPRSKPAEANVEVSFETDTRRLWRLEPGIEYGWFENGGRTVKAELRAEWDVNSKFSLSTDVAFEQENGVTEWASNEAFNLDEGDWEIGEISRSPYDGMVFRPIDRPGNLGIVLGNISPYNEYGHLFSPIFGERDTRSFDLTLRGNITLSPVLSIQFYGQVFGARGRYMNFALLEDKDTLTPLQSYPKTHDFAFTTFQTNTVLRWEYRPGSTLFLVWTQSRSGNIPVSAFDVLGPSPYDRQFSDQLMDSFNPFPTNVFLIKFNYMFLR